MKNELKKGDIVIYKNEHDLSGDTNNGAEFLIISSKEDSSGDFIGLLLNDVGSWEHLSEIKHYYEDGNEGIFLYEIDFPEDEESHQYSFTLCEENCTLKYKTIPDTKLARILYKNMIHKEEGGKLWVKA